jgi:hypothetical protein
VLRAAVDASKRSRQEDVMRRLVGEALLTAWEQTRQLSEQEAVLALLALGWPGRNIDEFANLPLDERNALLLELRAATLSRRMDGFVNCPECGAHLEIVLDAGKLASGIRAQHPPPPSEIAGYTMRAANTLDLLATGAAEDQEQARAILLARTMNLPEAVLDQLDALDAGARSRQWLQSQPAAVVDQLLDRFRQMNESAEIRIQFHCAVCRNHASVDVDIARFFLREIASAARRLMADIHELASAYGWSERSIAGMSATRRAAYLEMLGP